MASPVSDVVIDVVEFTVERGKVREFARASFAEDAVHVDPLAAGRAGYSGVLATATHSVVTGHYRDQRAVAEYLGLAIERIVVGSVSWEYGRPLADGDRLVATRRVEKDESREGSRGPLRIVTLATEFVDASGVVVLVQRDVLIERAGA
jgi:acyl dehydratase